MVEWKKLGEVCAFNRGKTITAKDAVDGDIPVIAGGQTPSYYHNVSNRDGESITVAGSGAYAGFVAYWNQPIYVSDAFTIDPTKGLKHKYLFHWAKMNQEKIIATQKGAGVPHVHGKDISHFLIPIPSLSEQSRIVGILDTFTASIDNLKEQIAERRKQYEYEREMLLDLEGKEEKDIHSWGECCEIKKGNGVQKA
ncbi:MAG: restriction endonuclease subunit S, partial [Bacteroidaceae bacterium]|nr:restriction endonuclease subunit S [Bacteroidaceae bacterium]